MNKRPVTVIWKLAIFLATVGFGANFTLRAPERRSDDQQKKTHENDNYNAINSILEIGHRVLCNGVKREF